MAERVAGSESEEKVYNKITPELLLPQSKLTELKYRLKQTPQWKKLDYAKYDDRGIRLSFGDLDVAVPFIHHMLGVNGVELRRNFSGRKNRFSTTELQLHNVSSLFDLIGRGKISDEEILNSFPNLSNENVLPFISAISLRDRDIEEIWKQFQRISGDEDKKNFGLGIQLARKVLEEKKDEGNNYYDVSGVFNFGEFPGEKKTRVQLTSHFGKVRATSYQRWNGTVFKYSFSDLKTRADIDHSIIVQALTKKIMTDHFVDWFFDEGHLERIAEPYVAYGVKGLSLKKSDHDLSYRHLDIESFSMTNIPVEIDYHGDGGFYFWKQWFGFYSDAFNAYKKELRRYLKDGAIPENHNVQHELPLIFDDGNRTIFDLSKLEPVSPKKVKAPGEPHYTIGESTAAENCPTCALPMTQYCEVKTDMGGNLVILRVQLLCQGHHFSSENKKVRREFLKYKNTESSK